MAGTTARLAVLVLLAAPTLAQAEMATWGQIDLQAGAMRFGSVSGEAEDIVDRRPESYDIAGRIGADWGKLGAQLDLSYGSFENDTPAGQHHAWGRQAALRLTYDVSASLALGVVYGVGRSQPQDDPGAELDFQAVEGAYMAGNWALGLQVGRFDAVDAVATNAFHDGSFARASAIYSLSSAGVISAELGLFDGRQDGSPDATVDMEGVTFALEYSRQIGDLPLAWTAGIETGHFQKNGPEASAMTGTRATIGLTAWFGDGDLAAAKRRGVFGQPDFGYVADTGNLLD